MIRYCAHNGKCGPVVPGCIVKRRARGWAARCIIINENGTRTYHVGNSDDDAMRRAFLHFHRFPRREAGVEQLAREQIWPAFGEWITTLDGERVQVGSPAWFNSTDAKILDEIIESKAKS